MVYEQTNLLSQDTKLMESSKSLVLAPQLAATAELSRVKQHLLDALCQFAYAEGNFTLSSGQQSPYYINCKPVTLDPAGAVAVGRLLLPLLPPATQAVAGLTLGADPIVTAVSIAGAYAGQSVPALIIRKQAKGHGTQAYIEGPALPSGAQIVVLEDVVTTGQSALTAVQRLRDAGYQVDHVLALVDRQQGGAELYQRSHLKFQALFTIPDIQQRYAELSS
jgi:orotate phosphoribosyltransferase